MKTTLAFAVVFAASLAAAEESKPLLAIPGKVIYESKLDSAPAAPWKAAKGAWELADGAWKGAEKPEDHHGAVIRMPEKLPDFIIEYELKFEGAKSTTLSINAVKDHMARIIVSPSFVQVQRDDNDHEGPDKAVVFGRFKASLQPGVWHKVRMEMVGDTLLGQVGDIIACGSSELFTKERMAPGFTVSGQSVCFRNLKITEATLNPAWEQVKATLPKGQPAPAPVAKGGAAKKGAKKPKQA